MKALINLHRSLKKTKDRDEVLGKSVWKLYRLIEMEFISVALFFLHSYEEQFGCMEELYFIQGVFAIHNSSQD